ncbi:MAG: hypothetical protein GX330_05640 [Bacteroidales bacterium]|nr:hypothetical protein [Bacteroidales bacterium]
MKTQKFKQKNVSQIKTHSTVICFLLAVFLVAAACEKEKDDNPLMNTQWKLVGVFDTETLIKEFEPHNCATCYVLTFDNDTIFSGYSSNRYLNGRYHINYTTNDMSVLMYPLIQLDEVSLDGYIYIESLENVQSFSLSENMLRLYFNKSNYLLFKSVES